MRLAFPIAIALLAAALLGGCGGESGGGSGTSETAPAAGGAAASEEAPPGAGVRECAESGAAVEELRATEISCAEARQLALTWPRREACELPRGSSRGGCGVDGYRCIATRAARGVSVSCARPGHSAAFIVRG